MAQLGIAFDREEESRAFEAIILEELEIRIGTSISDRLSDELLDEFDSLAHSEASAWLKEHCPDCDDLVAAASLSLKKELLAHRDQLGCKRQAGEILKNGTPVSALDLTEDTLSRLEKAGILTYGELVAVENLSALRTLRPKHCSEIRELAERVKKKGIASAVKDPAAAKALEKSAR